MKSCSCRRLLAIIAYCTAVIATASADTELFVDTFGDLAQWQEVSFAQIETRSVYESADSGELLRIASDDGASMLVLQRKLDIYETPVLRWRWRVTEDVAGPDLTRKGYDDAAIRIYVAFRQPMRDRSMAERLWAGMQKRIYGEIPPDSALSFVWTRAHPEARTLQGSRSDRHFMVVPDMDAPNELELGRWSEHRIDVLRVYRDLFGTEPPREAYLAVMGDSDNTDSRSEAWIDYVLVEERSEE